MPTTPRPYVSDKSPFQRRVLRKVGEQRFRQRKAAIMAAHKDKVQHRSVRDVVGARQDLKALLKAKNVRGPRKILRELRVEQPRMTHEGNRPLGKVPSEEVVCPGDRVVAILRYERPFTTADVNVNRHISSARLDSPDNAGTVERDEVAIVRQPTEAPIEDTAIDERERPLQAEPTLAMQLVIPGHRSPELTKARPRNVVGDAVISVITANHGHHGEVQPHVQEPARWSGARGHGGPTPKLFIRKASAQTGHQIPIESVEHPPQRGIGGRIGSRCQGRRQILRADVEALQQARGFRVRGKRRPRRHRRPVHPLQDGHSMVGEAERVPDVEDVELIRGHEDRSLDGTPAWTLHATSLSAWGNRQIRCREPGPLPDSGVVDESAREVISAWRSLLGSARIGPYADNSTTVDVTAENGCSYVLKRIGGLNSLGERRYRLVSEYRVLLHLWQASLPVALPQLTDSGELFARGPDDDAGIYTLLPALPRDEDDGSRLHTNDVYAKLGAVVGRLHHALARYRLDFPSWTVDLPRTLVSSVREITERLPEPELGALLDVVDKHRDTVLAAVADLQSQRIHGDCHGGNILVHRGDVSGLIDLDHLPIGPRTYDLAYYLANQVATSDRQWLDDHTDTLLTATHRLLDGYRGSHELAEREAAAVVPATMTVQLRLIDWHLAHDEASRVHDHLGGFHWVDRHAGDLRAAIG